MSGALSRAVAAGYGWPDRLAVMIVGAVVGVPQVLGRLKAAAVAVAAGLTALWLWGWLDVATHLSATLPFGADYTLYTDATRRWLEGGSFYYPWQLTGPYPTSALPILYPPTALILFVPLLLLPAVLWWAIPLGVTVWVVLHHRPSALAWAGIMLCLWWPPTDVKVWSGNPVMWAVAAAALGTVWRPGFVGVLLKPTHAPFALLGARDRRWWLTLGLVVLVSAAFAPLWFDYARVMLNVRDPRGPFYSVEEGPMLMVPLLAWLGRRASS